MYFARATLNHAESEFGGYRITRDRLFEFDFKSDQLLALNLSSSRKLSLLLPIA